MAERLTEQNKTGWALKLDDPQNEFEARQQLMSKFKLACEKLGKLEDILEKYGIESVEELDYLLEVFKKMRKQYGKLNQENCKSKKELDTWKRACELACKELEKRNCFAQDKQTRRIVDLKDCFYQQAKTEGNDE